MSVSFNNGFNKGYFYVISAAMLWGISAMAVKLLFATGIGPFEFVQIRISLALVAMTSVFGVINRNIFRIRFKDIGYFLLIGGLSMAFVQAAYLYAINKIHVAAAVILQYTSPIIVMIFSVALFRERLTWAKLIALFAALAGCFLVAQGYSLHLLEMNKLGVLAALISAVCLASYSLLGERSMHYYSPWTVLYYSLIFAALTWHILHPPFIYLKNSYSPYQWVLMLFIGLIGTVVTFGLYLVGINYIRATRASIIATLEPIVGGLAAFLFLGETMEFLQILGILLVIGAVLLLQLYKEYDTETPQFIRERSSNNVCNL